MKSKSPAHFHQQSVLVSDSRAAKRGLDRLNRVSTGNVVAAEVDRLAGKVLWTYTGYGDKKSGTRGSRKRPSTDPIIPASIPRDLKERPQWVCWDWSWRETYWGKPPLSPVTKGGAFEDDPATWSSFEQALTFAHHNGLPGVGYVFSEDDPFAGVDIDDCRNPESSEVERSALSVVAALHSYSEISPSRDGLHILVRGKLEDSFDRRKKVLPERFDRNHYFTMTGMHVPGTPQAILPREQELRSLAKLPPDKTYSEIGTYRDEPSIRGAACLGAYLLVRRWDGCLEVLDAGTGVSLWQRSFDHIACWASSKEHLLFICADNAIFAVETSTGTEHWHTDAGCAVRAMHAHADKLILSDPSGEDGATLKVMNANTGTQLWTFTAYEAQFYELIDISLFDQVICVTGYNDEDESPFESDGMFHSVALDLSTGVPMARVPSSGADMVVIDDLYTGWINTQLHERWSEYDRKARGQKWFPTRRGIVMRGDDYLGLACYDLHTDEELWRCETASTDFPFIATQGYVYASLADDPAFIVATSADTGVEVWRCETRKEGWAYPVHATDEVIYVLERTEPRLYCLSAQSGDQHWSLSLAEDLDACPDAERGLLHNGSDSRNLEGLIAGDLLVLRTGHVACAIQLTSD